MVTAFIHEHLKPGQHLFKLIDSAVCLRCLFLNVINSTRLALPLIITWVFFLRFSRHFTPQLVKLFCTYMEDDTLVDIKY